MQRLLSHATVTNQEKTEKTSKFIRLTLLVNKVCGDITGTSSVVSFQRYKQIALFSSNSTMFAKICNVLVFPSNKMCAHECNVVHLSSADKSNLTYTVVHKTKLMCNSYM